MSRARAATVIVLAAMVGACQQRSRLRGEAAALPGEITCAGITLVLVPQGRQLIGTNNSRAHNDEKPECWFTLDYPLYLGQTEVTVKQWREVMGERLHRYRTDPMPVGPRWTEATEFCKRFEVLLEKETGQQWECRLPREAEWEYAACYGQPEDEEWWPEAFHYLIDQEWFEGNSGDEMHPVAQKRPNKLGLYDMLGNVQEWCDGWRPSSMANVERMLKDGWKQPPADIEFPHRPIRGGHYYAPEDECRPCWRACSFSDQSHKNVGFRVAARPKRQD